MNVHHERKRGNRHTLRRVVAYARAVELYVPPKRDPNEQFPQDDNNWYYADMFIRTLLESGGPGSVGYARVVAEKYPNIARAQSRYGEALALAGRRDEAAAAFNKALQIDPMDVRALAYRRALLR